jgi:hypothetical protein
MQSLKHQKIPFLQAIPLFYTFMEIQAQGQAVIV